LIRRRSDHPLDVIPGFRRKIGKFDHASARRPAPRAFSFSCKSFSFTSGHPEELAERLAERALASEEFAG
jgi:hypothetical protein